MARLITDEMLDVWAVSGTYENIAARLLPIVSGYIRLLKFPIENGRGYAR